MTPKEIRDGLKKLGIKQTDLAREYNTSVQNVNNVIHGRSRANILRTVIAQKLNIPIDDIWPTISSPLSKLHSN